jgi:Fe(3+) dicitrate transport protein
MGLTRDWGASSHRLEFGVRLHRDEEDRFQEDDRYGIRSGRMALGRRGLPGSQSNRIARAEAVAAFFEDRISFGRLTLTPGLRFESISTERIDFGKDDPQRLAPLGRRENSLSEWIPGLGASFRMSESWSLALGVHRGFAPPSPSSGEQVEPEESTNLEFGARFASDRRRFDLIAFVSDYSNLLGADTASSGGTGSGDQFNGGAVRIRGLEASYSNRWSITPAYDVPLTASYTYSTGEFETSFDTSFADWQPRVNAGDRLPYLAEHQLMLEVGLQAERWQIFVAANYSDAMRTRAGRGPLTPQDTIEDRWLMDLATRLSLGRHLELRLEVRNLLDRVYVASRRPYGLRPGLPRTASVGFELNF